MKSKMNRGQAYSNADGFCAIGHARRATQPRQYTDRALRRDNANQWLYADDKIFGLIRRTVERRYDEFAKGLHTSQSELRAEAATLLRAGRREVRSELITQRAER